MEHRLKHGKCMYCVVKIVATKFVGRKRKPRWRLSWMCGCSKEKYETIKILSWLRFVTSKKLAWTIIAFLSSSGGPVVWCTVIASDSFSKTTVCSHHCRIQFPNVIDAKYFFHLIQQMQHVMISSPLMAISFAPPAPSCSSTLPSIDRLERKHIETAQTNLNEIQDALHEAALHLD